MIVEYVKGDTIITKDKKHILKVCDTRDEHTQGACSLCFFFQLKGLCTFNREKYLGKKLKGLPCKGITHTHCVIESSFYYFKEIKGGI